jgi:hypothetical protein
MSKDKLITKRSLALVTVLALSFPLIQLRGEGNPSGEHKTGTTIRKEKPGAEQRIGIVDIDWLMANDPECKKQEEILANCSKKDLDYQRAVLRLHMKERVKALLKTTPVAIPVIYSEAVIAGNTVDLSKYILALLNTEQTVALSAQITGDPLFVGCDVGALYNGLSEEITQKQKIEKLGVALTDMRITNRRKIEEAVARGMSDKSLKTLESECGEAETRLLIEDSDLIQNTTTNIHKKLAQLLPEIVGEAQYVLATDITPMPIASLNKDLTCKINAANHEQPTVNAQSKTLKNPLRIDSIEMSRLRNSRRYSSLSETERKEKLKELATAELARRGDMLALDMENCKLGCTDITSSIISQLESAPLQNKDIEAERFVKQCTSDIAANKCASAPTWSVYAPALPIFYLGGASSGFILPCKADGREPTAAEKQEQYYQGELLELNSFIQDAETAFGKNSAIVALFYNARGLRALKNNQYLQAKEDFASAIYIDSRSHEPDVKVMESLKSMGPFFEHRPLYEGRGKGGIQAFESSLDKNYWIKPGAPTLDTSVYCAETRMAGYFHNFKLVADRCKTKHSHIEKGVDEIMRKYKPDSTAILTKI